MRNLLLVLVLANLAFAGWHTWVAPLAPVLHAADDPAPASGEEVLGLAVAEEGVHAAVEEQPPLELQRGHPQRVVSMQAKGEVDEGF